MTLFPFQRTGADWLKAQFRGLLADEPGLGKTIQVLTAAQELPGVETVLVVCPATLKQNWVREARIWAPKFKKHQVISSFSPVPVTAPFVVINYDILHAHIPALKERAFDLVVGDEAHNLKNTTARRSVAFFRNLIDVNRLLLLTGTPIPNRPRELWPLLRALDEKTWASREAFESQYCGGHYGERGWWADGATNLPELYGRLQPFMFRRLKKDVLPELPPKFHQIVPLETRNVWEQTDWRAILGNLGKKDGRQIAESEMAKLRREEGLAKASSVVEHCAEILENKNKLVVFHYHRETGQRIFDGLKKYGAEWVHGGTPLLARQKAVDEFQTNNEVKVFVGQIQAAGEGITLTAADTVVFAEMDWVPGRMMQAEDRLARIGQKNNVLVQYLVSEGTFDAWMGEVLVRKMKNTEIALGDVDVIEEMKKFQKEEL